MNTGNQQKAEQKPIVLVVDGDIERRFRTSVYLQRLGYHAFAVGSAEEALAITGWTVPRLVITELILPRMSGIELLKSIKQDPRIRQVPVLIYTGIKDDARRQPCHQAGCSGYLVQTGDQNELYEAVEQATQARPRHFVRLSTWLDVAITGPEGAQTALVTAISEQGMFVNTTKPLPLGTTAQFTLYLPNLAAGGVRLDGRVLYSHAGGDGKITGMGVKFLQIPPEARGMIRTFIGEKLSQGLATTDKA